VEPLTKKSAGRELGNAAAAGAICGIDWESYQWYVRTKTIVPEKRAPGHVAVDTATQQRLYPLKAVRAWNASRPGRGNWNGEGARARTGEVASIRGNCPVCHRRYGVRVGGEVLSHKPSPEQRRENGALTRCPGSGQPAEPGSVEQPTPASAE
jgi:hypothetical protein